MKPYVIKEGDYLDKIAHALGFDAAAAWGDPKNADLAKKRDPNQLHPGDILYVPEVKPAWLPLAQGTTNKYVAQVPKTKVQVGFHDEKGPLAGKSYVVLGLGAPREGTTDGDGLVDVDVPVHVREIQVSFPAEGKVYAVRIGDMDPVDQPSGLRKRLEHLGYYATPSGKISEGEQDARDLQAIRAFQKAAGLEPTGVADDGTRSALVDKHGS